MRVPGAAYTVALGINERGQVVGHGTTGPDIVTGARGFLLARGVERTDG